MNPIELTAFELRYYSQLAAFVLCLFGLINSIIGMYIRPSRLPSILLFAFIMAINGAYYYLVLWVPEFNGHDISAIRSNITIGILAFLLFGKNISTMLTKRTIRSCKHSEMCSFKFTQCCPCALFEEI